MYLRVKNIKYVKKLFVQECFIRFLLTERFKKLSYKLRKTTSDDHYCNKRKYKAIFTALINCSSNYFHTFADLLFYKTEMHVTLLTIS